MGLPADTSEFKLAAGRFASGVTVVTTAAGGLVYGITVSAFASLSLDPLQVLVSIWRASRLHDMILESRVFAVSILQEDQRRISEYFSAPGRAPSAEAFDGIETRPYATGAPIIDGCLAHFDCRLGSVFPCGDHSVFVGEVEAVGSQAGRPLLYFSRNYGGVRDWDDHPPVC